MTHNKFIDKELNCFISLLIILIIGSFFVMYIQLEEWLINKFVVYLIDKIYSTNHPNMIQSCYEKIENINLLKLL